MWALFLAFQIAHVVVAHCSSSFIVNFSSKTRNSWKKSHTSFLHFCTFPLDRDQALRVNGHSHSRCAPVSGRWQQNSQFLSTSTLRRRRLSRVGRISAQALHIKFGPLVGHWVSILFSIASHLPLPVSVPLLPACLAIERHDRPILLRIRATYFPSISMCLGCVLYRVELLEFPHRFWEQKFPQSLSFSTPKLCHQSGLPPVGLAIPPF